MKKYGFLLSVLILAPSLFAQQAPLAPIGGGDVEVLKNYFSTHGASELGQNFIFPRSQWKPSDTALLPFQGAQTDNTSGRTASSPGANTGAAATQPALSESDKNKIYERLAYGVTATNNFASAMAGMSSFSLLSSELDKETNIYKLEQIGKAVDFIGNIAMVAGPIASIFISANKDLPDNDKLLYSGISISVSAILKGVQNTISTNAFAGRLAISRIAYTNVGNRINDLSDLSAIVKKVYASLNPIVEQLNPPVVFGDIDYGSILTANIKVIYDSANTMKLAYTAYNKLIADLSSETRYYASLFKNKYNIADADNTYLILSNRIEENRDIMLSKSLVDQFSLLDSIVSYYSK